MDQKTITGVTLAVCILCLALSAYNLYASLDENDSGVEDKVVLYFGLDSDSSESNRALLEAATLDEIVNRGFGYTMYWAEGGYVSDTGTVFGQDTLVIMITFIDMDTGKDIAKAIKKEVESKIALGAVLIESYDLRAELFTF